MVFCRTTFRARPRTGVSSPRTAQRRHRLSGFDAIHAVPAQQEDLTKETEQQNLPGTTWQYPNWKRKMRYTIEELESSPRPGLCADVPAMAGADRAAERRIVGRLSRAGWGLQAPQLTAAGSGEPPHFRIRAWRTAPHDTSTGGWYRLERLIADRIAAPVLVVEMPPLEIVHMEACASMAARNRSRNLRWASVPAV